MQPRVLAFLGLFVAALALAFTGGCDRGSARTAVLATTTSVQDSGLLDALLPAFERASGVRLEVHAVGSGQAMAQLERGEAAVAITHAPEQEQAAIGRRAAAGRVPFMFNDFVIVGPRDHAGVVAGAGDVRDAMGKVAASGKKFVSRGDGSGTHVFEQKLWKMAGVSETGFVVAASAGMAATLERASKEAAFTLTDRSTFIRHKQGLDLAILFQGDDELRNVYSVLEPPASAPAAPRKIAHELAAFVRSPEGRALVGKFGVETYQEPLFTPLD